jgi:hydrogenase/urease accessory protein HupE
MFGALGLALAFPSQLPLVVLVGLVAAYGLARLYGSFNSS